MKPNVASGPSVFVLVRLLWHCILVSDPCLRFTGSQVGSRCMWTDGLGARTLLCRSQGASVFTTAILPVVLYVCESCLLHQGNNTDWGWSITGCWGRCLGLRGPKLQNTGENCIVRSFQICTLAKYYFDEQIKKYEMGGACRMYGEWEISFGVLVWKHEGKRPLVRSRRRWYDNIKTDLKRTGQQGVDRIHLTYDRTKFGLLWLRSWTLPLRTMRATPGLAEEPSASQEGPCSVEVVSGTALRLDYLILSFGYATCMASNNRAI